MTRWHARMAISCCFFSQPDGDGFRACLSFVAFQERLFLFVDISIGPQSPNSSYLYHTSLPVADLSFQYIPCISQVPLSPRSTVIGYPYTLFKPHNHFSVPPLLVANSQASDSAPPFKPQPPLHLKSYLYHSIQLEPITQSSTTPFLLKPRLILPIAFPWPSCPNSSECQTNAELLPTPLLPLLSSFYFTLLPVLYRSLMHMPLLLAHLQAEIMFYHPTDRGSTLNATRYETWGHIELSYW